MSAWLPTLLVILLTSLALTAASSSSLAASMGRRLSMAGIFLIGSLAIASTVWEAGKLVDGSMRLAGAIADPQPMKTPSARPAATDLTKRIKSLEDRVRELESDRHARNIPLDVADKLAAYLQQFGSRRVIVSCIPDDIEAYQYANQIVNILKEANWDAQGPELTRVFGDFRTPKINIFVNAADHSDTAKLLLDGLGKFNIPYQSGVTPRQAIPDIETVELFIGTKQSDS
jgi:hypothetical protein